MMADGWKERHNCTDRVLHHVEQNNPSVCKQLFYVTSQDRLHKSPFYLLVLEEADFAQLWS